jgi:hypothetical protein
MLAGVVYCTQVLGGEKLLSAAARDAQTEEDLSRFFEMRRKCLADGSCRKPNERVDQSTGVWQAHWADRSEFRQCKLDERRQDLLSQRLAHC